MTKVTPPAKAAAVRSRIEPVIAAGFSPEKFARWLIVPHGPLHYLPFAALGRQDGPNLIERAALTVCPSASLWLHLAKRPARDGGQDGIELRELLHRLLLGPPRSIRSSAWGTRVSKALGVTAITHHRLAHELHNLDVPLIPRIISEIAHSVIGIDIHPGAQIGGAFFIDHGTGVVVGETCSVGERVRLYQGVTLGARSFPLDSRGHPTKGIPRHPIVEDDVTIYAGATILGRITIGRGSTIGGNVWLTRSVPPMSRVAQAKPKRTRTTAARGSDRSADRPTGSGVAPTFALPCARCAAPALRFRS